MAFVNIGSMLTKKDKDEDGNVQYYIKVQDGLEIKFNGKKLDGLFINVDRPTAKLKRLVKAGKITPEQYDEEAAQFEKDGKRSFVKFDISAKTE